MIIGVPKEIKEQEYRVALLPSGAYQLIKRGHEVLVERGAGLGSGYADTEYDRAGSRPLTEALMKSGVTALAYETVEVNRRLPLLEPMSEIAGRMSILVGGYFLQKHF